MLVLSDIAKTFNRGGGGEVTALAGINLTIEAGDCITVIGSNGAGKSTLLSCLAGSFVPDSGRISLDGADITAMPEHKRAAFLGRVFQDPLSGTSGSLTIEQNMALAARRGQSRGLGLGVKDQDREHFRSLLATLDLGLENRLQARVRLLSGGQRQAMTMLMATMVRPRLLLLDEHTAALDPKTARHILDLTQHMVAEQRLTALMVTHNMHEAIRIGNRLIMMHQGQIIVDLRGPEKANLTVEDLLSRFVSQRGDDAVSDRMLLT